MIPTRLATHLSLGKVLITLPHHRHACVNCSVNQSIFVSYSSVYVASLAERYYLSSFKRGRASYINKQEQQTTLQQWTGNITLLERCEFLKEGREGRRSKQRDRRRNTEKQGRKKVMKQRDREQEKGKNEVERT